ncbi:hypothetical protein Y695_01930 [Hydrogenophaga sp. T4]|nr:hypothetical protein Y695_01930 [Hydrogenophaga sp. T4]
MLNPPPSKALLALLRATTSWFGSSTNTASPAITSISATSSPGATALLSRISTSELGDTRTTACLVPAALRTSTSTGLSPVTTRSPGIKAWSLGTRTVVPPRSTGTMSGLGAEEAAAVAVVSMRSVPE